MVQLHLDDDTSLPIKRWGETRELQPIKKGETREPQPDKKKGETQGLFQGFHPSPSESGNRFSLHLGRNPGKIHQTRSAWPKPFSVDLLDEDHLAAVVMKKKHRKK